MFFSINMDDDFSQTILSKKDLVRAALYGRLDLITKLQLPIHDQNDEALRLAIKEGHTFVTEYLLKQERPPNQSFTPGFFLDLIDAIRMKQYNTINVALTENSVILTNISDEFFSKIIIHLVTNNYTDIVKRFVHDTRLESIHIHSMFVHDQVTLRTHLLEISSSLDMVVLLTTKDQDCAFAVLSAAWKGNLDILRYLHTFLNADLHIYDNRAILLAAQYGHFQVYMYLKEHGCEPPDGKGIGFESISEDGFDMIRYLLDKEWSLNYNCMFRRQFDRYIRDMSPERLNIIERILRHPNTDQDDLRKKIRNHLVHYSIQLKPLWDIIFKYIEPSLFAFDIARVSSLEFIVYLWEEFPSFQTAQNATVLLREARHYELIKLFLMNNNPIITPNYVQIKGWIRIFIHQDQIVRFLWEQYPNISHSQEIGLGLLQESNSCEIVKMVLRDPTIIPTFNTTFLSRIKLDYLQQNMNVKKNSPNIIYTILQDPRTHLFDLLISRNFNWLFTNGLMNPFYSEIAKMLLKSNQNIHFRNQYKYLWNQVLEEEQNTVLRGRIMMEKLKITDDVALSIMQYDDMVYRHSSMICVSRSVIFDHYRALFNNVV